jgi:hypothetical protein
MRVAAVRSIKTLHLTRLSQQQAARHCLTLTLTLTLRAALISYEETYGDTAILDLLDPSILTADS